MMRRGFLFLVCCGSSVRFLSEHPVAHFELHCSSQAKDLHQLLVEFRSPRQLNTPPHTPGITRRELNLLNLNSPQIGGHKAIWLQPYRHSQEFC